MGVGSQPHSPPELVRISPPRPTDPWTRANTAPPRCRLPGRGPRPGNTAHARRAPSAVRTRPLLRCRARPWACERWRGERHRQTPGDHATNLGATMLVLLNWLRRPILRGGTRRAVTQRASASLCTKCTRFDIIAVLYTCTTVASRVATNACATHLRFLTKPQTSSGLASRRSPGVVKT